jgi:hypothetical protein
LPRSEIFRETDRDDRFAFVTGAAAEGGTGLHAEVKDDDGNVKGSGEGRLEITITQVNEVTVEVPR